VHITESAVKVCSILANEKYVEDLEKIDYVNIGNESDINSTYENFLKSYLEKWLYSWPKIR
jgi:hypothetical protein